MERNTDLLILQGGMVVGGEDYDGEGVRAARWSADAAEVEQRLARTSAALAALAALAASDTRDEKKT